MGVVRARVTFPYKVGQLFSSAGPLRADLVKFVFASRDFPRAARPRWVLAAAPGRPPAVRCGALRCSAVCSRGATGRSVAINVGRRDMRRRASEIYIEGEDGQVGVRVGAQIIYLSPVHPSRTLPTYIYLPLGSPGSSAPSDWPATHVIAPSPSCYVYRHASRGGASWLVRASSCVGSRVRVRASSWRVRCQGSCKRPGPSLPLLGGPSPGMIPPGATVGDPGPCPRALRPVCGRPRMPPRPRARA